jgi:phosphonate transport system ATP-binding protein
LTSSRHSKEPSVQGFTLEDVAVSFRGTAALDGVTLSVKPGERLAIIGASGAGKTTLFRTLTRGVALSGGRVTVGGRDLYVLSKSDLKAVRRRIGSIYQAYNLVPQLSAGVNVALGEVGGMNTVATLRTFLAGPDTTLASRVTDALERVGLGEKARARTADLSGGQQQRVAVARLLVQRPDLVLADEPFAAVDPVTTERVFEALLELTNQEGATLVVNLHDVGMARRFPRVVALREGRVAFDGAPEQLSGEALNDIYAGDDPHREVARPPEPQGDVRPEEPLPLAEGRDGVSSH